MNELPLDGIRVIDFSKILAAALCVQYLQGYCSDQPERLQALQLRFSAPVYPGEILVTDLWRDGDLVSFCSRVSGR